MLGPPPPPQVWSAGQVPQLRRPPQVSLTGPQFLPWSLQLLGTHTLPPSPSSVMPESVATIPPSERPFAVSTKSMHAGSQGLLRQVDPAPRLVA